MSPVDIPDFRGAVPTVARIDNLALLAFDGPDAAAFLHAQLSTDVEAMPEGSVTWTSYNSPKGRMLASLLLWHRGSGNFHAFVAADLAEALRKRLSLFVLRAKVTLTDRTADSVLLGVAGDGARGAVAAAFGQAPDAGHGLIVGESDVIATQDGRYLVRSPQASASAVRARFPGLDAAPGHWDWVGVRSGVPTITRATQDLFVPQTTNFDLVGGIHFRKGCYPGQEIVARMQYLGRLKERTFAFHVDAPPPAPATPIFGEEESAVGTVVNAAPAPGGGSDLLAVVSFAAAGSGGLRLGAREGPVLTAVELPYTVPAPTAPNRVKL